MFVLSCRLGFSRMIHLRAITITPRPPRSDTRVKAKPRADIHARLAAEIDEDRIDAQRASRVFRHRMDFEASRKGQRP